MKIVLLLLCFVLLGCENKGEEPIEVDQQPQFVTYVGTDINGELKICEATSSDLICTSEYGPNDQFADDCRAQGYKSVSCGCHDSVCMKGSETGLDFNGYERSCDPMPTGMACTMEFTEEDQYAFDCRESGREAVQCGCHDWICK